MANLRDIDIGKIIARIIEERHLSYSYVARELNVDRSSLYHILKSKSIDIERLIRLGEILDYDFLSNVYLPCTSARSSHPMSSEELIKALQSHPEINITVNLPNNNAGDCKAEE